MESYDIRAVDKVHLHEALRLVSDVFMEYEAPEYDLEGIAEFLRYIEYDSIKEMLDSESLLMWVCYDNDTICGVIAVRPSGHISLMFVDGCYHLRGIARALLDQALSKLKIYSGCSAITVNSSPYAVGFYEKMGFTKTDNEQKINGIRFVPMKRPLN